MVTKIKNAVSAVWNFVKTKEPVVVINTVALGAVALQQVWTAELQPGDSWATAAWVGLTLVLRKFVTPAAK